MGDRGSLRNAALVIVLGAVSCTVASCASEGSSTPRSPSASSGSVTHSSLPAGLDATLVSVTDGDTIRVRLDDTGGIERVRLIGIDTPETKDPRTVVECFGAEAAAHAEALLPSGTALRLETDVEQRDRYGRFLAYVWRVADGLFVNEALVEGGWAAPYRYPPNVKYADRFSRLGAAAREANAGLWGACGGIDTPATSNASE